MRSDPRMAFLVNGLSWPATERLTYRLGEKVRWRVVNLSSQRHPMHMHGFYYEVDSLGDGLRDTTYAEGHKQRVVTQLLQPGSTMAMTWTPERAGNWLFHCHIMHHVSPERRLTESASSHAGHHAGHDPAVGMAGLVLGVTVLGPNEVAASDAPGVRPRKLTLTMQEEPKRSGAEPAYGFVLTEEGQPPAEGVSIPGSDARAPSRRARGDHAGEPPVRRRPRSTGTAWSSTASTTACTAGAASVRG